MPDFEREEIYAVLDRLAAERALGASDRRVILLRYLIEKEMAGEGASVTAYGIALDVLGRSDNFDPNTDAAVRAEVGRIRQALSTYFETKGANEEIKFTIPSRSYRVQFEAIESEITDGKLAISRPASVVIAALAVAALAVSMFLVGNRPSSEFEPFSGPRVAVAAFNSNSEEMQQLAHGMRVEMVTEIARFDWLTVFLSSGDIDSEFSDEIA